MRRPLHFPIDRLRIRACFGHRCLAAATLLLLPLGAVSDATTLTWGVGAVGGSGTWNTTTANWWDGSQNVAWPSGGDAVFAGAAGTVSSTNPGPVASSMTFNTPGYVVQTGNVRSSSSGLSITTNADATISSTLSNSVSAGNSLVKNGSGKLTVAGTNFLRSVQINQGEYLVSGSSSLFFSNVTLANAAGVTVTLGQSITDASIGSLSGGGTLGGVVQPDTQARTVTLSISGTGTFGGVLRDNGSGILALSQNVSSIETLTNANTYSGATSVSGGTLSLAGNGSILNSAITGSTSGTLVLDSSTVANANRVSDSAVFTLKNSGLQMIGNSTTPVEEMVGNLNIAGVNSLSISQPGSAATLLTFSGFTRTGHATLNVTGTGVKVPGIANGSTGIVTPAITEGNDWAVVGGDGRIAPFSSYAANINAGSTSDHVKLTTSGTTTLGSTTARASLNLQNSNASTGQVLDLGAAQSLGLTSGGILTSGAGTSTIQNGSLSTSAQEWVITANNNLTILSPILEGGTATDLTKSGSGTLTLSGTNTYAGTTTIDQGTLVVASDSNLGTGSTIEFGSGTLRAAGSFSSTKGFTNTTPLVGNIDSAGFNVTFSGANTGGIGKRGAGTLTLSNGGTGTTFVSAGTLALPNATSGDADLLGGTLQATGALSSLTIFSSSTLDLGGPAAAALVTTFVSLSGGSSVALTIDFGVGSSSSDHWTMTSAPSFFSLPAGTFQFDFQNLGGLTTGVSYPLISYGNSGSAPSATLFALAPDMVAAGWAGTFSTTTTAVSIQFTSTPEPDLSQLLAVAGLGFACFRRFRDQKR